MNERPRCDWSAMLTHLRVSFAALRVKARRSQSDPQEAEIVALRVNLRGSLRGPSRRGISH